MLVWQNKYIDLNDKILYLFFEPEYLSALNTFASGLIQAVRVKTAGSHMVLHENFSSSVSATDSAKSSKDSTSLAVCTRKKFLVGSCGFFVSDVISGGILGHLGLLHLALGPNC